MFTPQNQGDRDAFHDFCREQHHYPDSKLMDAFVVGVRHGRHMQKMEHEHESAQALLPQICQCKVCVVLRGLQGFGPGRE